MRNASGMKNFSYCIGTGVLDHRHDKLRFDIKTEMTYSQPVTRFTGALSLRKHRFCTSAAISPPTPPVLLASWTMTSLPVLRTLSVIVSTSHGKIVRKSMSSTFAERTDAGM